MKSPGHTELIQHEAIYWNYPPLGPALNRAIFDIIQLLAQPVNRMNRPQKYLRHDHFACSLFRAIEFGGAMAEFYYI